MDGEVKIKPGFKAGSQSCRGCKYIEKGNTKYCPFSESFIGYLIQLFFKLRVQECLDAEKKD